MGLSFSSLVQTASQALEQKRQRQQDQADRAQRHELELMQRSLLQAQIEKLRTPPTPEVVRQTPIQDPVTGDIVGYNPVTNTVTPSGGRVHPKPKPDTTGGFLEQKAQAGAGTAVESIDEAEALLRRNANADRLPLGAALARGAKTGGGLTGVLGGLAEPLAQRSMTPDQQEFQAAMQRMVHSMVGLLPGSRQSQVLFNSLVNAYTPQPGESAQARSAKRAARARAREWLAAVAGGHRVPVPPELAAQGITAEDLLPSEDETAPLTPPSGPRRVPPRFHP
jgi:hypothetical protein